MNKPFINAHIDHLVLAAASLEEGVRWCQSTLGITPAVGGKHALFGTHNRLVRLTSMDSPLTYLEIIAIDPRASPTRAPHLSRWFDLDAPAVRLQLEREGPQLLHWVARVPNIADAVAAWRKIGIDTGRIIEASRLSPQGMLEWKITVPDDGRRRFHGTLPTLIEWGKTHPAQFITEPVLGLESLRLQHPYADQLQAAMDILAMEKLTITQGPAALFADVTLDHGERRCLRHYDPV